MLGTQCFINTRSSYTIFLQKTQFFPFLFPSRNVPQLQFTQPHSVSKDAIIEDLSTQYTQPHERWKDQHSVSKDVIVDDLSAKDYLSEEEALKFEPLTNVQDIVSMKQSTVKILGLISSLLFWN